MSTPPFGIHLGTLSQISPPRISVAKILIFAGILLLGAGFWGAIGWSAFHFFSLAIS